MKREVVETPDKTDEVASALEQLRFLKGSLRYLVAWPLTTIVITTLMWWLVLSHLDSERENLRGLAYADAQSLARSYADQLERTVEQLDQISLNIAHYWKESDGRLRLESQVNKGLYPNDPDFSVSIFDTEGNFRTSLLPHPPGASIRDRSYFKAQRDGRGHDLQIERVEQGRIVGKPAIVFSRRLTDSAQRFDGLVCISVPGAFLASFYEKAAEGENDVMAVVDAQGNVLASKHGGGLRNGRGLLRVAPVFHAARGVMLAPAQDFQDGRARIVAWHTAAKYPLVSVVALSEEDALAPFIAQSRNYKGMAVAASFLLVVICVIGSALTARLVWRKHHEAVVAETYRLAIEGAREGFFMARALIGRDRGITDFVVEDCNEQGAAMLGLKKIHLVGVRFSQLYPDRLFPRVMAVFCHVMETGFAEDEFRMRRQGAPEAGAWIHRRLVRSGAGIAVTLRDITDAKSHELSLQAVANTDALTALPNRYWLNHHLPQAIEQAARKGARLAVLYLDLDDFKNVNNTLGHDAGDQVLQQAGHRIQSVLRPGDQAVRLGGDEFTALVTGVDSPEDLAAIAGRILEVLSRPYVLADGAEAVLNASVGISLYPEDGSRAEALLQHADTAMYAAKHAGKGRFAFYASELTDRILERIGAERALRTAVDAGQFTLFYQPRVNATTGSLVSMEALVRWRHPERGIVAPSEFIPLAEETGLIASIGEIVIEQACAQLADWALRGLEAVPLSVNVSPIQFARGNLVETLAASAARHGIAPALLEMEITESCMMHDHDKVAEDIAALKAMGVRISVDDFGTGYSSLSQLQRMDLDVLKVDRAFTSELMNGRQGEAFFMTIVSMAHILNMQVVAEGVESFEQLSILRILGCNEIQGYLVSRPVCAEEAEAFFGRESLLPAPESVSKAA